MPNTELEKLEAQVLALATKVVSLETSMLLASKDKDYQQEEIKKLSARLDKAGEAQSKLFWAVVGTAISFVVTFALNGGFANAIGK